MNKRKMGILALLSICAGIGHCLVAEAADTANAPATRQSPTGPVQAVKDTAAKVGQAARETVTEVEHGVSAAVTGVGKATADVGDAARTTVQQVRQSTRDASTRVGQTVKDSAQQVRQAVNPSGDPAHPAPVVTAAPATPIVSEAQRLPTVPTK